MNTYTVNYTIFTHSTATIKADSEEAALQQVKAAWKDCARLRDTEARLLEVGVYHTVDSVGDLALDVTWVSLNR